MAYCIQCGVKLADGADECPLCKTKVVLPPGVHEEPAIPLFPEPLPPKGLGGIDKTRKGIIELIIALLVISEASVAVSMILAGNLSYSFIPLFSIAMISVMLILAFTIKPDFVWQGTVQIVAACVYLIGIDASDLSLSWSLIAACGLAVVWVFSVFPFTRTAKRYPLLVPVKMTLSLLAYTFLINLVLQRRLTWFVPVAIPTFVVFSVSLILFLVWLLARKQKRIPLADLVLGSLMVLFVSCSAFDLFLTKYHRGTYGLRWSNSLLAASVMLFLFLVGVSVSRRLRRFFTAQNRHH